MNKILTAVFAVLAVMTANVAFADVCKGVPDETRKHISDDVSFVETQALEKLVKYQSQFADEAELGIQKDLHLMEYGTGELSAGRFLRTWISATNKKLSVLSANDPLNIKFGAIVKKSIPVYEQMKKDSAALLSSFPDFRDSVVNARTEFKNDLPMLEKIAANAGLTACVVEKYIAPPADPLTLMSLLADLTDDQRQILVQVTEYVRAKCKAIPGAVNEEGFFGDDVGAQKAGYFSLCSTGDGYTMSRKFWPTRDKIGVSLRWTDPTDANKYGPIKFMTWDEAKAFVAK